MEKSIADMMQTTVLSGVETGSWECPDYPPPAYAMLQGPKVCIFMIFFLMISLYLLLKIINF